MEVILGALGGLSGHVFKWLDGRSQRSHEENMRRIGIEETRAEAEASIKVAAETTKGAVAKGELAAFRDSYKDSSTAISAGHDLPGWAAALLAIVDLVRGLMRPVLTIGLVVAALYVIQDPQTKSDLIVSLAKVAVPWWFGSRHVEKMHGAASPGAGLKAWGVSPAKINEMLAKSK